VKLGLSSAKTENLEKTKSRIFIYFYVHTYKVIFLVNIQIEFCIVLVLCFQVVDLIICLENN